MIRFDNVGKRYGTSDDALRGVSVAIGAGEMVVITGASGAGKSTLLKLVPAIERATTGTVWVAGEDITRIPARAIPYLRRNLGLVFQDQKLLFDRNVFENVMLPLRVTGYAHSEAARRVRVALDRVGLLHREKSNPRSLSGGEQQRIAIARAVVNRPNIVIADEPTANLDADYSAQIGELFRQFNQAGVTILMATHDSVLASHYATRRIELVAGCVIDSHPNAHHSLGRSHLTAPIEAG